MPSLIGTDNFNHNDFTEPGGGPYFDVVIGAGGSITKDTSIMPSTDPCSVEIVAPVSGPTHLDYDMGLGADRGWFGFFMWIPSAQTNVNCVICQFWPDGFSAGFRFYLDLASSGGFVWSVNNLDFQGVASIARDEWHWIEFIVDTTTTTWVFNVQVDGVTQTASSSGGLTAGADPRYPSLGFAGTSSVVTVNFAHAMWGTASSNSDWMGEPIVEPTYRVLTSNVRWA